MHFCAFLLVSKKRFLSGLPPRAKPQTRIMSSGTSRKPKSCPLFKICVKGVLILLPCYYAIKTVQLHIPQLLRLQDDKSNQLTEKLPHTSIKHTLVTCLEVFISVKGHATFASLANRGSVGLALF